MKKKGRLKNDLQMETLDNEPDQNTFQIFALSPILTQWTTAQLSVDTELTQSWSHWKLKVTFLSSRKPQRAGLHLKMDTKTVKWQATAVLWRLQQQTLNGLLLA